MIFFTVHTAFLLLILPLVPCGKLRFPPPALLKLFVLLTLAFIHVATQPRNFKLLAENEVQEKGGSDMNISFGLERIDDTFLNSWRGNIIGPQVSERSEPFAKT